MYDIQLECNKRQLFTGLDTKQSYLFYHINYITIFKLYYENRTDLTPIIYLLLFQFWFSIRPGNCSGQSDLAASEKASLKTYPLWPSPLTEKLQSLIRGFRYLSIYHLYNIQWHPDIRQSKKRI